MAQRNETDRENVIGELSSCNENHVKKLWEENKHGYDNLFMNTLMDEGLVPGSHESLLFVRSSDKSKLGFDRYKYHSPRRSYLIIMKDSIVVGQEFVLCCLLLAVHRFILSQSSFIQDRCQSENVQNNSENIKDACFLFHDSMQAGQGSRQVMTMTIVILSLGIILFLSDTENVAIIHRSTDTVLIALILRFLSTILRTLTSSYSSDTVMALSVGGMIVHLFSCDFNYANGINNHDSSQSHQLETAPIRIQQTRKKDLENFEKQYHNTINKSMKRPVFWGGTVSLNSAFFSTTLLASRISSNVVSYGFLSFSVILFAFYPAARHAVAKNYSQRTNTESCALFNILTSPMLIVTVILTSFTLLVLRSDFEKNTFLLVLVIIIIITPGLKWWLQHYKENFSGPWDISHT